MSTIRTIEISGQRSSDERAIHGIRLKFNKHDANTEENIKALQAIMGWRIYTIKEVELVDPLESEWRKQVAHGQTKLGFTEWKGEKQ
jgi:hypothetical protein